MIFCRMRAMAGVYLSAMLLLVGMSLAAHATQAVVEAGVSRAEMYATIGGTGAAILGAFWLLLGSHTSRMEKSVEALVSVMKEHHSDPMAHPAGSATRINPVMDKLDKLAESIAATHTEVVALRAEHNVIRDSEQEVCAMVKVMKDLRGAVSAASPRRDGDEPGSDHSDKRGA